MRRKKRSKYIEWFYGSEGEAESNPFTSLWETTAPNETITIPAGNVGAYDATIDWGDGSQSAITAYNDAELTHEYVVAGEYTVTIDGSFPHIFFNNGGDRLKINNISYWGGLQFLSCVSCFYGCSNLTVTATDAPDTSLAPSMFNMFRGATLFNGVVSGFDTSSSLSMYGMFRDTAFNKSVSNFDTSSVIDMYTMFRGSDFNQSVSNFDTSSVENMSYMFRDSPFNQSLSNFDTSSVITMTEMFRNCSDFDQDISGFDISLVTSLTNFMLGVDGLSTANYDSLLISWDAQSVTSGLAVSFGGSTYTLGGAAATARANLVSSDLWTIADGGGV